MMKVVISIAFILIVTSCFSFNSLAATPANNTQKKVTIDNDTAQADNNQELSNETPDQSEKQVRTRPRRRR